MTTEPRWLLLYTRQHAEQWAKVNLENQGFHTLLPRVRARSGLAPLFPRYLFAAASDDRPASSMRNTFGIMYVVHCGQQPARVPQEVIDGIRSRMDEKGVVVLDECFAPDPLFAARQRERLYALQRFAEAGFRVRAA